MKIKTNYFKFAILIAMLSLTNFQAFSQSGYSLNEIIGKTWIMSGMTDKTYEDVYDNTTITSSLKDNSEKKYVFKFEYYLSDSIEDSFDPNKVGKVKTGKYLIERPLKDSKSNPNQPQPITIMEIKELSSSRLVLCNIKQQNNLVFTKK